MLVHPLVGFFFCFVNDGEQGMRSLFPVSWGWDRGEHKHVLARSISGEMVVVLAYF